MYEVSYKELILDPLIDTIMYFLDDKLYIRTNKISSSSDYGISHDYSVHAFNVCDYSYIGFKEKLQRSNENENT